MFFLLFFDKGISMFYLYKLFLVIGVDCDEEDIRLELWGLKEVVYFGEFDINVYFRKLVWKDDCFLSLFVGKYNKEKNYNYLYFGGKVLSCERSKFIKIFKSFCKN